MAGNDHVIIPPFAPSGVHPLAIFPFFLRFSFYVSSPLSEHLEQAFVNVVQRSNVFKYHLELTNYSNRMWIGHDSKTRKHDLHDTFQENLWPLLPLAASRFVSQQVVDFRLFIKHVVLPKSKYWNQGGPWIWQRSSFLAIISSMDKREIKGLSCTE